jgi:hypothetical protein
MSRNRQARTTRLVGCVGTAAAVGWVSPAEAAASVRVMFPDNPPVTITAPPAPIPLSLDQTFSATGGTGHAILKDGPSQIVLKGLVQAPVNGATLFEELNDVLHFSNLAGPTPISFHFVVDGTVVVPVTGISELAVFNNAFISPGVTMGITANRAVVFRFQAVSRCRWIRRLRSPSTWSVS